MVLGLLELELWTSVSCHVAGRNLTPVLCKNMYTKQLSHIDSQEEERNPEKKKVTCAYRPGRSS